MLISIRAGRRLGAMGACSAAQLAVVVADALVCKPVSNLLIEGNLNFRLLRSMVVRT